MMGLFVVSKTIAKTGFPTQVSSLLYSISATRCTSLAPRKHARIELNSFPVIYCSMQFNIVL